MKNSYQLLATDDLEENTDESSCESDDTLRVSNVKTQVKSKENDENNYNIEQATIEMINTIMQEYLLDEKAELREINCLSSNIAIKLTFHYQNNLENLNNQLGKRVTQLERINNECHQYIGELLFERTVVTELPTDNDYNSLSTYDDSMKGLKKGFLLEEKVVDDDESTESFSNTIDSNSSNNLSELLNDGISYRYEKRILGLGENKNKWNLYNKNIVVRSDNSDSIYSGEEYATDEDYRLHDIVT